MPRGGSRPGSGRPPGSGNKAKEKVAEIDAAKELMESGDMSPMDFLLSVMRDKNEDKRLRIQCASIAAPYVHAKKGEPGKREQRAEAAQKVASKFVPNTPPRLVSSGGRKT